jgi:hypothetical protein
MYDTISKVKKKGPQTFLPIKKEYQNLKKLQTSDHIGNFTFLSNPQTNFIPWLIVKISKSIIIIGNAATCSAIYELEAVGTVVYSASTGTSDYYVY